MKACKRIEIVVERSQLHRVTDMLQAQEATGYTVVFGAGGSGDRGPRRADDVTNTDENCVVIVATEDNGQLTRVVEAVQPLLKRYGGICLVSEALLVPH